MPMGEPDKASPTVSAKPTQASSSAPTLRRVSGSFSQMAAIRVTMIGKVYSSSAVSEALAYLSAEK